jgi:hypothetical protein
MPVIRSGAGLVVVSKVPEPKPVVKPVVPVAPVKVVPKVVPDTKQEGK